MYLHFFKANILKLELTSIIHDLLSEDDIIQLKIKANNSTTLYSARVDYKGKKCIYVELIDEIIKVDDITFVQRL